VPELRRQQRDSLKRVRELINHWLQIVGHGQHPL
jgi:hypothetical protein